MILIMKQSFKYTLIGLALVASSLTVSAQTVIDNGIATKKTVTNVDGKYNISLEVYATGGSTYSEPVTSDIVLVLDVSGSMDETLGTPEALASTSYTYDSYGYNTYYYKDGNNYYPVYRAIGQSGNNTYYFLYYIRPYGNSYRKYYLYTNNGNTDSTQFSDNEISGINDFDGLNTTVAKTSSTATLFTGVLYKGTRMDALKSSVNTFITKIKENGAKLPAGYYNKISIVKFGLQNNSSLYYSGQANHVFFNNASVVADFTEVTETGAKTLTDLVDAFIPGGGTGANLGLTQALNLINSSSLSEKSKKTVVLFTDGEPSYNDYYNPINTALQLKNAGVKVYTVGIFDDETDAIKTYMGGVSSNYPQAQASNISQSQRTGNYSGNISLGNRNTDVDDGGKLNEYYFLADSQEGLEAIFATLAESSGAPDQQVGSSTQVRDMVASSFSLPEDMELSDVTYSVWKVSGTGDNLTWTEDATYDKSGIHAEFGKKNYTENGKTIQRDTVGVTGFDFSKDDTSMGAGDGNWVGVRIPDPNDRTKDFTAGRKLVISFDVEPKEGVTGGDTQTNGSDSGVYVYNAETKEYELKNAFYLPETQLPINIQITKIGLRHGESATFKIMKIDPKKDEDGNIQYNSLGKPIPNEKTVTGETDPYKAKGYKNFSKVILTNKGTDGARVTKTLLNLDPNWVYLVIEDDWAWAYDTVGAETMQTTSSVTVNPFSFEDTEKTGVVKHAEAVMINHFATSEEGEATTEHFKSSKVESF